MRSHGPGWTLDPASGEHYWLWAPQDDVVRDPRFPGMWSTDRIGWHEDARPPRARWAACWQAEDGEDGDFIKGDSADAVLGIFPANVRRAFRRAMS